MKIANGLPFPVSFYGLLLAVRPAPVASFLKRLVGVRRIVRETPMGRFYIDPASNFGFSLIKYNEYEPDMAANLLQLLLPGDTFVDLGANEGYFSVIAAKVVGSQGRVISIEPQFRLAEVIATNFRLNEISDAELVAEVIGDSEGTARFFLSTDMNTGSSGLVNLARYRLSEVEIPQTTLSKLFQRLGVSRISLMKVDIEGGELDAILGSPEIFREMRIDRIALELHPQQIAAMGKTLEELTTFLQTCGYRYETLRGFGIWVSTEIASS